MTLQAWSNHERGRYFLRHAGHDLLLVRNSKSHWTGAPQYLVLVDNILADTAYQLSQGKTKAIKLAERLPRDQRPEPIVPPPDAPLPEGCKYARPPDPVLAPEAVPELPPVTGIPATEPDPLGDPLCEPAVPPHPEAPAAEPAAEAAPPAVPTDGTEVQFTITGHIDGMPPADAVAFLKTALSLLREHGVVEAKVIVPRVLRL